MFPNTFEGQGFDVSAGLTGSPESRRFAPADRQECLSLPLRERSPGSQPVRGCADFNFSLQAQQLECRAVDQLVDLGVFEARQAGAFHEPVDVAQRVDTCFRGCKRKVRAE